MTPRPATTDEYAVYLSSILAACWPRVKVTDETCLVWAKVLEGLPENVADEAVDRASRYDGPPSKRELEDVVRAARETLIPELPLEPERSGRTLTLEEWRHGHFHLSRFWASGETRDLRDPDEFDLARKPWTCECEGWRTWTPPNPRADRVPVEGLLR